MRRNFIDPDNTLQLVLEMAEELIGVIDHTEGKGKSRTMKKWSLVFTSSRMIASKISGTLGVALSGLSGVLGEVGRADINRRVKEMAEDIPGMSAEDILNADKDNFAVPYSDIVKVETKKGGLLSPTSLKFSTTDKKYQFNILKKEKFDEYVELVRTILPGKVS
jgi:hypothetical protein